MQTEYSISARPKTSPTQGQMAVPARTLAAVAKPLIVDALGIVLAWCPTIAMILGKVVTRLWPHFRRV